MTKVYIISVIKKINIMTNKAKQTWKKVPLHMAYQRGYEVEECGLKLIKQTWLQNLEDEALEAFQMGVAKAQHDKKQTT